MPKVARFTLSTARRDQMVEVTNEVSDCLASSGVTSGICVVYVPHTTAGVCVQENADPDVQHDLLAKLAMLVPHQESFYRHAEGNSDSHLKAVMTGTSVTLLVEDGRLVLGRWQGVYLCEFDGPRPRQVCVKIVADSA